MKLTLEQINEMIHTQNARVLRNADNVFVLDIGIEDHLIKSFRRKLFISKLALARLLEYRRKLLIIESFKNFY